MKKTNKRFEIIVLLSFALFCFGSNLRISAQVTPRERVIVQPTPPVTVPTVLPTPIATPTPVQTIQELQSRIRLTLSRAELRRGQVGIKIISLDTNKIIFEENAEKYFMPASNMKSYTVAAAMARLTPNFRFVTSVYAPSAPDAGGVIRGDLTVYGRGDPSFSPAFTRGGDTSVPATNGDYLKGLDALAQKIVAAGVKRIEGNLVGDESYFNSDPIPATWEWDDLQWYYGAEVSALTLNDNALDLKILPSAVGSPLAVQLMPNNSLMQIINRTTTAPAGAKREIEITKRLAQNILEVSGKMAVDDKGFTGYVTASRPALLFAALLRQLLEQKGVTITGQTRAVNFKERGVTLNTTNLTEITKLESPPFSLIAAKTMKPSQNLYTELILRALGEAVGDKTDPKKTSEARGLEVVQKFLAEAGITPGSVVQYDGSGLSRHNLITPASSAQLYGFMNRHPFAQNWRESLTIAGVDGTLKSRFTGTFAAGNVRGKTGTIDQVSALSGYVTTASGERFAFSILTNNLPEGRLRTATIDEIVVLLANFNGRTN